MSPEIAPKIENGSFDSILKAEFQRRQSANSHYSLRAFAQFLGTDVSQLSKLLTGKRALSPNLVQRFGSKLGLPNPVIEEHQQLCRLRSKFPGKSFAELKYIPLTREAFENFKEPLHYVLFELAKTKDFRNDPAWISEKIGCPPEDVHGLVERLKRTGLLQVSEDGQWTLGQVKSISFRPNENITSEAHREIEKKILIDAIHALDEVPIEKRDQSSMMMATNGKKIQQAKKLITQFRRELCAFLEDTDEKDAVYQLSISLFPSTLPKAD